MTPSIDADRGSIGIRAARHLDIAFRSFTVGHGAELGSGYLRWLTGEAHPLGNLAIVCAPGDEAAAREACSPLKAANVPCAVAFPDGLATAAAQAVHSLGFSEDATMPAMAVNIERLAPTALPPGYAFVRAGVGDTGARWAEGMAVGYELPHALARRFSPEVIGADPAVDARTQFFSVVREGRTVATSMFHLADGLAGIYCVSTRPEERGKGIGAHVTAEALRVAASLGCRVGVLQSSPAGHSIYIGLGFEDVGAVPMFVRMPS